MLSDKSGKVIASPITTVLFAVGAGATAAYNAIFGTAFTSVPVENSGGSGTRDAHWRETTFQSELMTGYISGSTRPLSRVTVASLGDLGYSVNMLAADNFTAPGPGALQAPSNPSIVSAGWFLPLDSEPVYVDPIPVRRGGSAPAITFAVCARIARPSVGMRSRRSAASRIAPGCGNERSVDRIVRHQVVRVIRRDERYSCLL